MTIDGVGEWSTATVGRASSTDGGHSLQIESAVDFPHSLGLFYSALTDLLGFEVNEGEYKVMGMAPYGEPRFLPELERVLHLYDDGSFWLDLSYFSFHYSTRRAYSDELLELLGVEPRPRNERFWTPEDADASPADLARSQRYADIAASVQAITERAVVNLAREAQRRAGSPNLCFAGGVALNVLANRRILDETPVERLFIPPAPGDSGGALGAALHVEHVILGNPSRTELEHAYWGSEYDGADVDAALRDRPGVAYHRLGDERERPRGDGGGARPGRRGRLVPGPLRARPAGARRPQHHRRPAQRGDEGAHQREDQVPRAVPAVRAGRRRRRSPTRSSRNRMPTSRLPGSCS